MSHLIEEIELGDFIGLTTTIEFEYEDGCYSFIDLLVAGEKHEITPHLEGQIRAYLEYERNRRA